MYRNSLEDISIDLWDDVLYCHSVKSDNNIHKMKLENLYNPLIDAMFILSNYFNERKKVSNNRRVGRKVHCKDLHSDARHNFSYGIIMVDYVLVLL